MTPKKRAFAVAWARGASPSKAAVDAGYSEKTAPAAGSRLTKDKHVLAEVARLGLPVPASSKAGRKRKTPVLPEPACGYTGPDGVKTSDAPAAWPFGKEPPVIAPPVQEPPPADAATFEDPLEYIKHVVNDPAAEPKERLDAAKAWASYVHAKKAPAGKKEGRNDAAAAAAGGANPFAPRRRLEAVK
ncbi:terminase small subunit [Pigmentiphaga litoralis]|uniref:terminase small subunit n=1 Tax=Pigmentiphaga litoralis TaxID=516702 RepID=UPI00167A2DA8